MGKRKFIDGARGEDETNGIGSEMEHLHAVAEAREDAPVERRRSKKMRVLFGFGNVLMYFAITGGILFGLPRGLSHYLNTDFPMASITSGSMWPALKTGSLVFIEGIHGREAEVGDIVVFRNDGGSFTIHRVVRVAEGNLITKGDANFTEDDPVDYENVIGRAVTFREKPINIPYVGSITVFASNLKGGNE